MTEQDHTSGIATWAIGRRLGRAVVVTLATLFVLQIGVASCPLPERVIEWLSCNDIKPAEQPRYVVLLGGSIPSQAGLIRAYYAAEFGRSRTGTTHIISMPANEDPTESGPGQVRDELVLRGIPSCDILFESKASNTYEEAVLIREMLGDDALAESLLIVTSPSHMRRAFLCFRKQGFRNLTCLPAEDIYYEVDIGGWGFFRYTFWYRLGSQPEIAREFLALAVYKLRGWI
jgi:uncharacterized SAM-binding protein YcdF (DUF218 family)